MGKERCLCAATGLPALAAMVLLQSGSAAAQQAKTTAGDTSITIQHEVVRVSGHIGLGYLSGEVNENVYDTTSGRKISQLTWKLDDVYMLNVGGSISPRKWLTLNGDVWFKLNDGSGSMDDYDWFIDGYPYTHRSSHDNTEVTEGYMVDLNAAFTFYQHGETAFNGLVGYKRDSWEWEARGGSYVYSTNTLYDTVGNFPPGAKVITYSQWYDVPYVGLGFHSTLTNVSFMGRVIFSPFAMAGAEDTHHMRNLVFEDDFDPTTMFAVDLGFSYDFTSQLALLGGFHYQQYAEATGSTTITDQVSGAKYYYDGDAAGTDHESYLLSLSVQYNF